MISAVPPSLPRTRVVLTHAEIWLAMDIDQVVARFADAEGHWARFTTVEGVPVVVNLRRVLYVQHEGR